MSKEFDIVVFGASGFTGKHVVEEIFKKGYQNTLKVALAGRSRSKLQETRDWVNGRLFVDEDVGMIEANVEDPQSLLNMCKQTKMVLNCVGPYRFYGEPVVKACLSGRCDYIDVTGEPEYMERIRSEYQDEAMRKNIYIIVACGFDCIPSELGMIFAKDRFDGTLGAVENYFHLTTGKKGMIGNYGTYSSLVNSISGASVLRSKRKSHAKKHLPFVGPKLKLKGIHYSKKEGKYAMPFFGADVSVVRRSQRYFFENRDEVPAQFSMYFCSSFFTMVCIVFFMLMLKLLTSFSLGTKMLLRYPSFFTAGSFTRSGPSRQQIEEAGFMFNMYCHGYKNPPKDGEVVPYDNNMVVRISGPEIGYALTPIVLVQAGTCLLEERSSLPATGGVYTPGPSFRDTSLIQRLIGAGITFKTV